MNCQAYEEWVSIYDFDLEQTFQKGPSELKRASMIFSALQREFKRIQEVLTSQFSNIKADIARKKSIEKCAKFHEPLANVTSLNKNNKENIDCLGVTPIIPPPLSSPKRNGVNLEFCTQKSPTLLKHERVKRNQSRISPTVLFQQNLKTEDDKIIAETELESLKAYDDDILEASVIDVTPEPKIPSKCLKLSERIKKKCSQQSAVRERALSPKRKKEKKELTSSGSSMDIDEMLSLINHTGDSETVLSDETIDNLDIDVVPSPNEKKLDGISEFVKNYDKVPKKKTDAPNFAFKEVLRGRERKTAKGWSCKECEDYYTKMNLSKEELEKKMDECSRHRGRFKPRQESYPGFWDLTFAASPETPKSEKSFVFQ